MHLFLNRLDGSAQNFRRARRSTFEPSSSTSSCPPSVTMSIDVCVLLGDVYKNGRRARMNVYTCHLLGSVLETRWAMNSCRGSERDGPRSGHSAILRITLIKTVVQLPNLCHPAHSDAGGFLGRPIKVLTSASPALINRVGLLRKYWRVMGQTLVLYTKTLTWNQSRPPM